MRPPRAKSTYQPFWPVAEPGKCPGAAPGTLERPGHSLIMHHPVKDSVLQDGQSEKNDKEHHRNRGSETVAVILPKSREQRIDHDIRRIIRPCIANQDVELRERLEALDGRDNTEEHQRWGQQRQAYISEGCPPVCAINTSTFVQLLRDGLQTGEDDNKVKAQRCPNRHKGHCG